MQVPLANRVVIKIVMEVAALRRDKGFYLSLLWLNATA
jgi:hypothetical protein